MAYGDPTLPNEEQIRMTAAHVAEFILKGG